jgi:hypothetical protein
MESIVEIISQYQIVITLILTPVASGIAAYFSARQGIRAARVGRVHASTLEISKYRQDWINSLRDEIADFIGAAGNPNVEGADVRGMTAMAKIHLRMNPKDQDCLALVDAMIALSRTIKQKKDSVGIQNWGDANSELIEVSHRILKREWERLKNDLSSADQ